MATTNRPAGSGSPGSPRTEDTSFSRAMRFEWAGEEGRALVGSYGIAIGLGIAFLLFVHLKELPAREVEQETPVSVLLLPDTATIEAPPEPPAPPLPPVPPAPPLPPVGEIEPPLPAVGEITPVPDVPPRVVAGVGGSRRMIRSAVAYADELNLYSDPALIDAAREELERAGRSIPISVFLHWEAWPDDLRGELARWEERGVARAFVNIGYDADLSERVGQLAEAIGYL